MGSLERTLDFHTHPGSYLHLSPSLSGETVADSYSIHPPDPRGLPQGLGHCQATGIQRPRPPLPTLGYDVRGVSCGRRRRWFRSLPGSMFQCTHAIPAPTQPRPPANQRRAGGLCPRGPLALPDTKKLKYFNILFYFLVPEFILWVLGSHCVIYIYIICIYILYFFGWVCF